MAEDKRTLEEITKEVKDTTVKTLNGFAESLDIDKKAKAETKGVFEDRIMSTIDGLGDDEWDAMSAELKKWSNDLNTVLKATAQAEAEAKAESGKGEDDVAAAKEKAKKKAKAGKSDKVVKTHTAFKKGTNSEEIGKIIEAAGEEGLTMDEAIKACEKAKINSSNIPGRVKMVLSLCVNATRNPRDPHFGIIKKLDNNFIWVGPNDNPPVDDAEPKKKKKKDEVKDEEAGAEETPEEEVEEKPKRKKKKEEAPAEETETKPKEKKKKKK